MHLLIPLPVLWAGRAAPCSVIGEVAAVKLNLSAGKCSENQVGTFFSRLAFPDVTAPEASLLCFCVEVLSS